MKFALTFVALTFVALLATAVSTHAATPALTDLDGKAASLDAGKKDKELVVFWATWCEECRGHLAKELPELNGRPDVAVVTVNTDRDAGRVKEFVAKEGIQLPVLRDPSKDLRSELKIFSVPYWAVYRRDPASHELKLTKSEAAFDMTHVMAALNEGGAAK